MERQLRQSYVRVGPRLLFKNNRYGYARQTRRLRRTTAKLQDRVRAGWFGILSASWGMKPRRFELPLPRSWPWPNDCWLNNARIRTNSMTLHAPEVECIAKGKVPKRYEFGVKVSIGTTNRSNLVVGAQSLPGQSARRPYAQTRLATGAAIDRPST